MIEAAIKVVTSNARALFTIAALIFVPLGVFQSLAYATIGGSELQSVVNSLIVDSTFTGEEFNRLLDATLRLLALGFALALLAGVGTVLAQGATVRAVADAYQGLLPDWRDSIRFGFRRFVEILAAVIVVWIGSTLGLIFCIVPGVWLFVSWSVTVPALVVEGTSPMTAIRRSHRLVRPRFWPVLGVIVISVLVYSAVSYLFSLIASLVTATGSTGGVGAPIAASVVSSTLSSILVQPFIAALLVVLYFDLRVRAEGYDLESMSHELGKPEG